MDSFICEPNLQMETTNRAGNLYFLQVNPNHSGSMECIPLQLIINDLDRSKEHYLRPVQLDKDLQLITDACAAPSSSKYDNDEEFQETSKLQQTLADKTSSPPTNSKQSVPKIPTKSLKNPSIQENCAEQNNTSKSKHKRQHQNISFVHIADRTVPPRAIAVLPTALQFRRDFISPRRSLPERVRFGPLQGVRHDVLPAEVDKLVLDSVATHTPVFLISKEDNSVIHVNVADKDKSNWLSLLPLGDLTTANVWLYEESGEIYGVTTQSVGPRTPLALGYSKKYAEHYGLPPDQPILDLEEALPVGPRQWWCFECHRAMGSAALLERHIDVYHKDEKPPPRRRYRCPHCTRTFSRLFTLKRHILSFCTRKVEKSDKPLSSQFSPIKTNTVSYTSQNADDSKVPSDESLQNYTNGLDFSTNLFDTDRMPSLDISGSSKSETDFNPYGIGFKDESHLTNYVGNTNGSNQNTEKSGETILFSCPHCDKTIVNSKKRQHLRQCAARRFECECGNVFNKKQSFEIHLDKEHSDLKSRTLKNAAKISSEAYKCDDCKVSFKRRGMLVNHLWRVHNSVSTAVPLERRVRHYPCVACPKIYRTASKRDRHVKTHHPGTELIRAAPIEGERRACEPASCWECPRQYATRAKLLQHVRSHHPHLELPIRKKSTVKLGSNKNKQIQPSLSQNCNYIKN